MRDSEILYRNAVEIKPKLSILVKKTKEILTGGILTVDFLVQQHSYLFE